MNVITDGILTRFVSESNRIEGIHREPSETEVAETAMFLQFDRLKVANVVNLVIVYAGARGRPRFAQGLDVQVGGHVPPKGGPHIQQRLQDILDSVNGQLFDPWENHCRYEVLHPFMDGNGRTGRAIWLWQMLRSGARNEDMALGLGFLHTFYYQTLSHQR